MTTSSWEQPRFRLQEPESISEQHLLRLLRRRAERLDTYLEREQGGLLSPSIFPARERELLDRACGEWVYRRGGGAESLLTLLSQTLGEAELLMLHRKLDMTIVTGRSLPQSEREERLRYVRRAKYLTAMIRLVEKFQ